VQNKSRETGIKPDILYQRYLIERFITRIACSEHKDSIVIKGGMLISAIAGVDIRATRDLDAIIVGTRLTMQDYEEIAKDVISLELGDNIQYQFVRAEEIIQESIYPCCRIHLRALFGKMNAKVVVDLSSGDVITPGEIAFGFPELLGNGTISILAYNLETVLAEKMAIILDLGVVNTRAKDFYDIYLFAGTLSEKLDDAVLKEAFHNTLKQRRKDHLLAGIHDSIEQILGNQDIRSHWEKYRAEHAYASEIKFEQIGAAILQTYERAGTRLEKAKSMTHKEAPKTLMGKLNYYQGIIDADKAAVSDSSNIITKPRTGHGRD
jgi:predicted nucleotidyltransferase component of viral defense system